MEGAARSWPGRSPTSPTATRSPRPAGCCCKPALGGLRHEFDPDTTGGAILLGLRGIAIVGHGSSGAEGVANAVRLAARSAKVDAVGRTAALLREGHAGRGALGRRRGCGIITTMERR